MKASPLSIVSVTFANGADTCSWRLRPGAPYIPNLTRTLAQLQELGHVVAYAIELVETVNERELLARLRRRLGPVVDVVVDGGSAGLPPCRPAFLMPVWPFDHDVNGQPASTGHLLGLDLQLVATPTSSEEVGAHLPDRGGLWLIHAEPLRA